MAEATSTLENSTPETATSTPETSTATPAATSPSLDAIRSVPKVLLHDHLDGGVRPQTVIDLATETGYNNLPKHLSLIHI